jgi:hypothetical protein
MAAGYTLPMPPASLKAWRLGQNLTGKPQVRSGATWRGTSMVGPLKGLEVCITTRALTQRVLQRNAD